MLLGALFLFAPAPAGAAVLVSNVGQTPFNNSPIESIKAQPFTTGSNTGGYTLTSIEFALTAGTLSATLLASIRAELWSDDGSDRPSAKVASLTVPASISSGNVAFAAPAGTTLTANTTYHAVLYSTGTGRATTELSARIVGSDDEDSGAATGWSIANFGLFATATGPGAVTTWTVSTSSRQIRINGEAASGTPTPPGVPENVQVTSGDEKLTLTWDAPSSWGSWDALAFDAEWKLSSASDSDWAAVTIPDSVDPSLQIVVQLLSAATSVEVTSLTNGTAYDLRIRAVSQESGTDGGQDSHFQQSDWVTVSNNVPSSAVWSATLNPASANNHIGCFTSQTNKNCSDTPVLSDNDFTYSTTTYTMVRISDQSGGNLNLNFNTTGIRKAVFSGLNFCVDTTTFAFADSVSTDTSGESRFVWSGANLSWAVGTPVKLQIAQSCPEGTQSSDADLSGLTASSGTSSTGTFNTLSIGTFSAATTSYTATVANSITHVKLTPTVNHASATVTVNGTTVTSATASGAIALSVGANTITVQVMAQDSTTKDYTVSITRQQGQQMNPTVSLSASPNPVDEGSPVTVRATLSAPAASQVVIPVTLTDNSAESGDHGTLSSITILAGSTAGSAQITTNQDTDEDNETFTVALGTLPSGYAAGTPNSVQITIRDAGGTSEVTLHVSQNTVPEGSAVTVEARLKKGGASFAPPGSVRIPVIVRRGTLETGDLESLLLHSSQRTSSFNILISGVHRRNSGVYNIKTRRDDDLDDETFTVEVDTANLPSNVTAGSPVKARVTITDDRTTIDDTTTDDTTTDDTTTDDTTTDDTTTDGDPPPEGPSDPDPSADASLSALEIEEASLDFDPDTYDYTLNAYDVSSLTLTPTANHEDAEITVTVNGGTVEKEGTSYPITLDDDGETSIEITVTAEDGTTTKTYTLTVMSCPREDRKTLEKFYEAAEGVTWHEDENWNSPNPPGQWFGVRTNEDGRVISLRLPDNGLSGEIPRELLCLELKELALWDNDGLSGEVPEELVLAVERAALRDVAVALSLNTEWFESYENPYDFSGWDSGVETDDDGRVTELDFSDTEEIEGTIPAVLLEQLRRLGTLYVNCTVSVEGDTPAEVNVEEVCEEPEPPKEPEEPSGGGGCALSSGSGDSPVLGLFLVTLLVFAVLGRKRAR